MKTFKEFIVERVSTTGTVFKVRGGDTGPNSKIRYKKTKDGWDVSKDKGETWKSATSDHPSPLFNIDDIDAEYEMGSLEKVK